MYTMCKSVPAGQLPDTMGSCRNVTSIDPTRLPVAPSSGTGLETVRNNPLTTLSL